MSGVGGRDLFVGDAAGLVVARQLGGDVEDAGRPEGLEAGEVGRVPAVAQVEEREHPGGRVVVYVLAGGSRRAGRGRGRGRARGARRGGEVVRRFRGADPAGRRYEGVFAQVQIPPVELAMTSCKQITKSKH